MTKMVLDSEATGARFTVASEPVEKTDNTGKPKADRNTGEVLYTTDLLVREEGSNRPELIRVTTAGRPEISEDERVAPVELEALYWTNNENGKHRCGIAWRAKNIMPVEAKRKSAGSADAEAKPVKAVAS